ncbi:MAG: hypothetical protein AAB657_02175 [Patescibacteria group bacterium]
MSQPNEHGTPLPTPEPTQDGTVIGIVITAVCTAMFGFSITELINALRNQGEKLTQYIRIIFTAFITKQEVILADSVTQAEKLLEVLGAVTLGAVKKFIANDYFKVGDINGIKIAWIGNNFKEQFVPKVEENVIESIIRYFRLKKGITDPFIIAELGLNYTTTLAHMWELIKLQGYGQKFGPLLVDGKANSFYIPDVNGIIWTVNANWDGGGWHFGAYSLGRPDEWNDDRQVLGR